jgi:hypothetical protein
MSSTNGNPLNNPVMIKSLAAFGLALAGDKFVMGNDNLQSSAIFAASVTGGIIGGQLIAEKAITSGLLPDSAGLYEGKLISQRLLELTIGVAAGYFANSIILKNDYNRNDMLKKFALIASVDVLSEYATDYFLARNVGYLVQ